MKGPLYQMQRKLSQRRANAVRKGLIGIIDIGSSKVICFILKFTPEDTSSARLPSGVSLPENVAFRVVGVATTRSRGVSFGEIQSIEEVERAIRTVVQAAQKMASVLIEDVLVCFSGGHPRSYGVCGETELMGSKVTELDISNALLNCDIPDYGLGREVIHALPVNFSVDSRSGLIDPRGQSGKRLTVDLHLITIEQSMVKSVIQAIKDCHLDLSGLTFSSYLSGLSSLTEDELQLGAGCIDLGAGSSGLSIFFRKQMIYAGSVRLGGFQITSDIMKAFQIPFATAERIKNLHGGLISTSRDDRDLIELQHNYGVWDDERYTISRSELIGVIRPRVEEILENLQLQLNAAGFENLSGKKVILTGGCSQLPGLYELANKILDCQVRVGRPLRIQGLPHATNGPDFAAAIGMALNAGHPQDECWDFKLPFNQSGLRKINGTLKWFFDNW